MDALDEQVELKEKEREKEKGPGQGQGQGQGQSTVGANGYPLGQFQAQQQPQAADNGWAAFENVQNANPSAFSFNGGAGQAQQQPYHDQAAGGYAGGYAMDAPYGQNQAQQPMNQPYHQQQNYEYNDNSNVRYDSNTSSSSAVRKPVGARRDVSAEMMKLFGCVPIMS